MDLVRLIDALSRPAAYPHSVGSVAVCQTHISAVFLAGPFAYKIKKPVKLGFLDFSTLDLRQHFCREEVRLNRRLAPRVYLGVVPIALDHGAVAIDGGGRVVECAVKMQRLPDDASLEHRLDRGDASVELFQRLARKIAAFHAGAASGEHISQFGRFDAVARNARDNFTPAAAERDTLVSPAVFERLRHLTEQSLAELRPLIERRAAAGMIRDTHGDLRLEHVYLLSDARPPDAAAPAAASAAASLAPPVDAADADTLAIIDCIEFNERFRFADPVADMAFLAMDLVFHNRRDLASAFAAAYFQASGDTEGQSLLPFYTAYRAAVRGKVEALELAEQEIPAAERAAAAAKARAHWLLALGQLERPGRRPCLILIGGLPGSGKSTLARGLAEQANLQWLRTDVVRKELAGLPPRASAPAPFAEGIYTPQQSDQTYAECLRRAESLLFAGERVAVDASFGEERRRFDFLDLAARLAMPAVSIECACDPETARRRLRARRGDASDADWSIYQQAAAAWQPPGPRTRPFFHTIATDPSPDQARTAAANVLRGLSLLG